MVSALKPGHLSPSQYTKELVADSSRQVQDESGNQILSFNLASSHPDLTVRTQDNTFSPFSGTHIFSNIVISLSSHQDECDCASSPSDCVPPVARTTSSLFSGEGVRECLSLESNTETEGLTECSTSSNEVLSLSFGLNAVTQSPAATSTAAGVQEKPKAHLRGLFLLDSRVVESFCKYAAEVCNLGDEAKRVARINYNELVSSLIQRSCKLARDQRQLAVATSLEDTAFDVVFVVQQQPREDDQLHAINNSNNNNSNKPKKASNGGGLDGIFYHAVRSMQAVTIDNVRSAKAITTPNADQVINSRLQEHFASGGSNAIVLVGEGARPVMEDKVLPSNLFLFGFRDDLRNQRSQGRWSGGVSNSAFLEAVFEHGEPDQLMFIETTFKPRPNAWYDARRLILVEIDSSRIPRKNWGQIAKQASKVFSAVLRTAALTCFVSSDCSSSSVTTENDSFESSLEENQDRLSDCATSCSPSRLGPNSHTYLAIFMPNAEIAPRQIEDLVRSTGGLVFTPGVGLQQTASMGHLLTNCEIDLTAVRRCYYGPVFVQEAYLPEHREIIRKLQITPPPCKHGERCDKGLSCPFTHTQHEKQLFRHYGSKRIHGYRMELCRHRDQCKNTVCTFAHNQLEANCFRCKGQGHFGTQCPLLMQPFAFFQ